MSEPSGVELGALSRDDVKRIAMKLNSSALYRFICMYEAGHCTWEQAMQSGALYFAVEAARQHDEIVRLISILPPQPIIIPKEGLLT